MKLFNPYYMQKLNTSDEMRKWNKIELLNVIINK
jgi:hypothetical protein